MLGPWGVLALVVVLAVLWMPAELTATYQVRIAMVLVALVPVAVVDLRHGVVPDSVLVALLGVRAVVLGIDVARDVPGVWLALRAEVAVAVVILAVLGLARLVNRRSIGVGDLKLFAVLPLLLGPQLAIWSIMASFVAAFVYTVFVLSTKRRSRRAAIPFAPFVLLGTLAAVVLVSLPGS
ncbi:prepilin peptidase [Flavimobilis sp. GY10621]|uniref:Prepilin peptidase n=1 Tax=Flavimobilis rhizosphaerae TaxID=2775421 RepID=A0ABR9DP85_9MICO|nr:A24 family peptidase [Flavimobilis rhizosphaerae]MBD9698788.1 prepilin peptidase [Flavimobilis rhizosphaerae]